MSKKLVEDVIEHTGLPKRLIEKELYGLFEKAAVDTADINIETLRRALAEYLQEVILAAREEFSEK